MADEEFKVKKERDPIMTVCFVVFMLTVCVITGATVYNNYLKADDSIAVSGSAVSVNYIGTYYDYYGEGNYAVFDTSRWNVTNNDDITKGNDFTPNPESAHRPLSFTIGDGSLLSGFNNAVIGHKIGEKIRVMIPAGEGYNAASTDATMSTATVITIPSTEVLTLTQFSAIYGHELKGYEDIEKSAYGWPASASYNSANNTVTMRYMPQTGTTYTMTDSDFGTVSLNVTAVSGTTISYRYVVSDYTTVSTQGSDKEIQMIMLDFGTEKWYIVSVTDHGTGTADSFTYRTTGERYNQDLYFEIEIVTIG
ncbi:MAG: FKBP-type peptidyl-prolyl cis-trans isomerase [Methanomassiliicoccaceae archaeon]|nr:FKBP-type peptidyl-prolyl cis-trans isomerase [Methanomassiliicoccaceae archaeon]